MKVIKFTLSLLIVLLFISKTGFGQEKRSESQLNLGFDSFLQSELNFKSINAQLVIFPESKFSLLYSLGFGVTDHQKFYAHFPLGGFWGFYLMTLTDGMNLDFLTTLAVISLFIPEGVCYNIDVNEKMKVSPYINFNSNEMYFSQLDKLMLKPSLSLGSKFSYKLSSRFGTTFSIGGKILSANGFGIHSNVSMFYQF